MNYLLIAIVFVAMVVLNSYLDTKKHMYRPGTPFQRNIVPNIIRATIVFSLTLLIIEIL